MRMQVFAESQVFYIRDEDMSQTFLKDIGLLMTFLSTWA